MLITFQAFRLENLLEQFQVDLHEHWQDQGNPLQTTQVLVQSPAMEKWLLIRC